MPIRSIARVVERVPIPSRGGRTSLRHRSAVTSAESRAFRLVAVVAASLAAMFVVVPLAAATVATQSTETSAAALRAQADDLANRYFDALARFQSLDAEIARNQHVVDDLSTRAKKARENARARAIIAYKTSDLRLSALINGADALDASHLAHLIERVNATDVATYAKLHAATRDLRHQQTVLENSRHAQADALAQLREQGATIDAKLAEANQRDRAAAAANAAVSSPATETAATISAAADSTTTTTTSTTTTTTPSKKPSTPTPPSDYHGTAGTSPHHDDPFLTCVRQRESGGRYNAVNPDPSGPYLGAYQFLQATWDLSANHAGLTELVGVPANVATPYDQDEVAWALYQWRGAAPWGGSCP
jgi:peptidoglycan hydrolase CwlO-like protein